MSINLLCIGDVVGRPGRQAVSQLVPVLVRQHAIDCVIANAENIAGGSGLTPLLYDKLLRYGVHLITLGDHIYRRAEVFPILEKSGQVARPANYPGEAIGRHFALYRTSKGPAVAVISIMGRLFMKPPCDSPFDAVDRVLASLPREVKIIVVDVHAEATSEKVALGWHLDGRVSLVFGTHTHVPTADERILPKGSAYITDLGMTGPYDSVLGRRTDRVLRYMRTGMPAPFDVAVGDPRLSGVIVKVDEDTGRATHIERVQAPCTLAGEGQDED